MTSDHYAALASLKAENLLREALVQRPEEAPGAAIHLAYYAMFHAARAVLILLTGTSPKRHSTLITQFGFHVKDRSSESRRASDNLNKLQARRIRADYSDTIEISASDAEDALAKAQAFLDLCAREFGFPRQSGAPNA